MSVGARLLVALAAAVAVPACGKDKIVQGTPGPEGPAGPSGANPPAQWSDPINISQQVWVDGDNAYGQQAVFTPDGRLHVVYYAYDYNDTGSDQLYYTSSAAPYAAWDAPVRLTDQSFSPYDFDLTAAADNSIHIVFARDLTDYSSYWYTDLVYTRNTADLRLAFTETLIYEETNNTGAVGTARILMRGTTAYVVWTDYDGDMNYYFSNSADGWPLSQGTNPDPTELDETPNGMDDDYYVFASDAAGNFHLLYGINATGEEIRYRPLPSVATSFGPSQQVSGDDSTSYIFLRQGPPIMQFDGNNNVYAFWKQWENVNGNYPALYCNIKGTSGVFQQGNAAIVTLDPEDNGFNMSYRPFNDVGDIQVTADGRIHAAWKTDKIAGTQGLYPLFYRTKDPGLDPSAGWQSVQVAAWLLNPMNSDLWNGGIRRSVLVRPALEETVHVFYSDVEQIALVGQTPELCHAYLSAGGTTWHSTGSLSRPTVQNTYPSKCAYSFFLDAGIEEDGSPYVLLSSYPDGIFYTANGDVRYTHYRAGEWAFGSDVNGPNYAEVSWGFWVGNDPENKLHAIWMQEVDPFEESGVYDLVHSACPVPSETFWTPIIPLWIP